MTEWAGVMEVAYGTVVLADPTMGLPDDDPYEMGRAAVRLGEEHCAGRPGELRVMLPERDDRVHVEVRVRDALDPIDDVGPDWEHVAETGFEAPTGRLQLYSWMPDEDLAAELDVPAGPLRARIHWAGLEAWLEEARDRGPRDDGIGPVRVRIDLAPGDASGEGPGVQTMRTWHFWAPPVHESVGADGLRRYEGVTAIDRRMELELLPVRFWSPFPTIAAGNVTSLFRDPADGSRWAAGDGTNRHPFLQELTPEAAEGLASQGFPPVRTFARDERGLIWSADTMPLERVPALLLLPPDRWAVLQGMLPPEEVRIVDLPAGWARITRRPFDGSGPAVLVAAPDGVGDDALYQRWPDGSDIPE